MTDLIIRRSVLGAGALALIAAAVTACTSGSADLPVASGSSLTPTASETATTSPVISIAPSATPATAAASHAAVLPPAKHPDITPKPSPTIYLCEGNAVAKPSWLNLACADQKMGLDRLRWSGWGSATAHATGRFWQYDCIPDCASGKLVSVPTRVTVSELANGHYGRLRVTVRPVPEDPRDYVLTKAGPGAA
ncbi:hypothetical protein ACFORO_01755 [Amycolatopsis halotolerans]|uniref:Lipoprotein n=1 Tax=Amycolatopsis halotolerans TaxID=330083 RepID=A0ABV7Q6H9_9PSEU